MPTFTSRRNSMLAAASVWLLAACGSSPAPEKTGHDAAQADAAQAGSGQVAAGAKPAETPAVDPGSAPASDATIAAAPVTAPAAEPDVVAVDGGWLFKKKLPAVGTRALEKDSKAINMALTVVLKAGAKPEKMTMAESTTAERAVEVLSVSADAVTKIRVTYNSYKAESTKNGAAEPAKAELAGKTYVVEASGGTTTVTTAAGGDPPEEEVKAVKKDFKKLGQADSMSRSLPDTPIKVGDRVDSIAQGLKDVFAKDGNTKEKTTVEKALVTFKSVKDGPGGKIGVFDYSFTIVIDTGMMTIRMPATGQVEVRIKDGTPLHITMKSPLAISSSSFPKFTGTGQADMGMTREIK